MNGNFIYTILESGELQIEVKFLATPQISEFLRVGVQCLLDSAFSQITWFGNGPQESYADRKTGAITNTFRSDIASMFTNYSVPQSNGNRTDTRWVAFSDQSNNRIYFDNTLGMFEFSASRYPDSSVQNAKHISDLKPERDIIFNFDYKQKGLGSATCGPPTRDEYLVKDRQGEFTIRLIPFGNDSKATFTNNLILTVDKQEITPTPTIVKEFEIFNRPMTVYFSSEDSKAVYYYTLDGSRPTLQSAKASKIVIDKTVNLSVMAVAPNKQPSLTQIEKIYFTNATQVNYTYKPKKEFENLGEFALLDAKTGTQGKSLANWVAFENDAEITIKLAKPRQINTVTSTYKQVWWERCLAPKSVEYLVSKDGLTFETAYTENHEIKTKEQFGNVYVHQVKGQINKPDVNYLKVKATNYGGVPPVSPDAGQKTFIYMDEIVIE